MGSSGLYPAFARLLGWSYGYPVAIPVPSQPTGDPARDRLPGVPASVPLAYGLGDRKTVCTGLTGWCVLSAYPELRVDGAWADLQIADHARPWSPLERVASIGDGIAEEPAPGWWLTQTWSGLASSGRIVAGSTGHARLVHVVGSICVVHEASATHGIRVVDVRGDRWRQWGARTRWARLP